MVVDFEQSEVGMSIHRYENTLEVLLLIGCAHQGLPQLRPPEPCRGESFSKKEQVAKGVCEPNDRFPSSLSAAM